MTKISFINQLLLAVLLLGGGFLRSQASADIDTYLKSVIKTHEVPGMAVAVVKGDQVLYENYFGLAELNHGVPVDEKTVFRVYSTTKVLVSVAIFQLVEMGKLSIDDPISKHLSGLPEGWGERKIKDLLAHASGLPDFKFFDPETSEEELMKQLGEAPIGFPAGERFAYNQTNYWLLANIIEGISEVPLEDFIRDHQLGGSTGGFVFSSNAHHVFPHRTGKYNYTQTGWVSSGDEAGRYGHAANGLAISLPRFIEWSKRLHQGKLLGKDPFQQLMTPYQYTNAPNKFMHGWGTYPVAGQLSAGFTGGWVSGYRYFPEQDMSIIYLSNGLRYTPVHNTVINHIAGMIAPELVDQDQLANEAVSDLFLSTPDLPLAKYTSWRSQHPDVNLEGTLNSLGYTLMGNGRLKDALKVFQLNARENPEAWNVYDSLAEAYAETGNIAKAKQNYQKSIDLNPDNQNGKDWLKKLNSAQ